VSDTCPKCGSDRITKLTQWRENKKGEKHGGCLGCLVAIIILILAPGLVLLVGIIAGTSMFVLWRPLCIALVIGIAFSIGKKIYESMLFVCEKCGARFK